MEYLIEYGLFLAKAVTIVVAIILVIGAVASTSNRDKGKEKKGRIRVTRLNEHFEDMKKSLREAVLQKPQLKQLDKEEKKQAKAEAKQAKADAQQKEADAERKKRVYVVNFKGDIAAHAVTSLREEITAILALAEPSDEVICRLESPGGMVHAYGLASSQLLRIKSQGIPLTICVDKVAASGGYMMACLADKLVAAPFSVIGSIGVLVQVPNFHRVLQKHDVDFEMISAGEYKRTLTTFGEITQKGRDKVKEDVETIHGIFKQWVKEHRPSVDIDKIATGETWLGTQAKERYMVDDLRTSDECIVKACDDADVFEVEYEIKKSIQDKLGKVLQDTVEKAYGLVFEKNQPTNFQ